MGGICGLQVDELGASEARSLSRLSSLSRAALPEPVALGVHLQDVHVASDSVQEGVDQALVGEDRGPLPERPVGGDDAGAALAEAAGLKVLLDHCP